MSHTSDNTYVRLYRTATTRELLAHGDHKALTLLMLIAIRARTSAEGFNPHGLEPGEAVVGDWKSAGLTRKEYRGALKRLEQNGLIRAIKATTKGTVVKLTCPEVYGVEHVTKGHQEGQERAIKGPSRGHQGATKNNGRMLEELKNGKESESTPTRDSFANWNADQFRKEVENTNTEHDLLTSSQANEFIAHFCQQTADGKLLFQTQQAWNTQTRLEKWKKTERKPKESEAERHAKLRACGEKWANETPEQTAEREAKANKPELVI